MVKTKKAGVELKTRPDPRTWRMGTIPHHRVNIHNGRAVDVHDVDISAKIMNGCATFSGGITQEVSNHSVIYHGKSSPEVAFVVNPISRGSEQVETGIAFIDATNLSIKLQESVDHSDVVNVA